MVNFKVEAEGFEVANDDEARRGCKALTFHNFSSYLYNDLSKAVKCAYNKRQDQNEA